MSSERTKLKQRIMEKLIEAKSGLITTIPELNDPAIFETLIADDEPNTNVSEHNYSEPKYDSRRYTFNGKKYNYLNNDTLSRDFKNTLIANTDKSDFNLRLCLFRLNHDCKEPFLQLFVEYEDTGVDKNIVFPGFKLEVNDFDDSDVELNNEYDNKEQQIFETNCFNKFQEITGVTFETAKKAYRGYITEYDNTVYPLFDCTYIDFVTDKKRFWGILDELINEQHVHDFIIDRNIFMMINHNDYLTNIKDELNFPINLPCCLYLVKMTADGNDYENVFTEDEDGNEVTSIVDPKIDHEVFGSNYYFTTDPIDPEDPKRLKRYSVFIDNSLYFLNIATPISEIDLDGDSEDAEDDETVKTHKDYTSIYFFENYKQLWCVKDLARFIDL